MFLLTFFFLEKMFEILLMFSTMIIPTTLKIMFIELDEQDEQVEKELPLPCLLQRVRYPVEKV